MLRQRIVAGIRKISHFGFKFNGALYQRRSLYSSHTNQRFAMAEPKEVVIGTHNGIFHCDEILAIFMLQQLPQYRNTRIVRTRDETLLASCDIVVDVGSVFDPERSRFDHHQKTFQHTLSSLRPELGDKWSKVRLSSAGLIYTFFGERVIRHILKREKDEEASDECVRKVYEKVYEYFIQEIDGIDNGVPQFADEPVYRISTHLSARVGTFNSQWNSADDFDEMAQFEKAKTLVGAELIDKILYYGTVWWPARSIVEDAIRTRKELHHSGEIIELSQMCPWKQHLYDLEAAHDIMGQIKYCIALGGSNDWRIICVPLTADSFVCRKFLPAPWRGIREKQLQSVAKSTDARFCHATGFIGGAGSRDGVLDLAVKSLEFAEENDAEKDEKKPKLS